MGARQRQHTQGQNFEILNQYINIFYNAPYSPFMNPIEEFFGYLKNKIRKINYKNRHELIKITN